MLLQEFQYLIHNHINLCDSVHTYKEKTLWQSAFEDFVKTKTPEIFVTYHTFLDPTKTLSSKEKNILLIELAKILEQFFQTILAIKGDKHPLLQQQKKNHDLSIIHKIRREFIQRRVLLGQSLNDFSKEHPYLDPLPAPLPPFLEDLVDDENFDFYFAHYINELLNDPTEHAHALQEAKDYVHFALTHPIGQKRHIKHIIFHPPQPIDYDHLVKTVENPSFHRDGFSFDDSTLSKAHTVTDAYYCLHCHKNEKDTCSKGMMPKAAAHEQHQFSKTVNHKQQKPLLYAKNPLAVELSGCPLRQKISQMHYLYANGYTLSALAVAMIDNPLLPATGHRICNDCMTSCIFQKQDPVNTPGVETNILKDILVYDYGVDLYLLLTRWNPLCFEKLEENPNPKRILVVGSGPSGFGVSYHLLQRGHHVLMVEGAHIASMPTPWPYRGQKLPPWPILCKTFSSKENIGGGFGGVMRYGITARWDKNYLLLIRLVLERYDHFAIASGVRFGGTITSTTAFSPLHKENPSTPSLHMDHIALCMGSGKPHVHTHLPLAKGVHYASDFLMALQLEGAFEKDSLISFDIELPAVVVGGGLTSMDTAVEILAYYPTYVAKKITSFQTLSHTQQQDYLKNPFFAQTLDRLLSHHAALENERQQAKKEKRDINFSPLFQQWGGVTLLYRGTLKNAPAYRLNHQEVQHALDHGIRLTEKAAITDIATNQRQEITHLTYKDSDGNYTQLLAKTLIIATGTAPNTNLFHDEPDLFQKGFDKDGFPLLEEKFKLHQRSDGRSITVFGDMHPSYHGSVVKALASAKEGVAFIETLLSRVKNSCDQSTLHAIRKLPAFLQPKITNIIQKNNGMVELQVYAPFAAYHTYPGQFFKSQILNASSQNTIKRPSIILSAYDIQREKGILSFILLHKGLSSHLIQSVSSQDPLFLMGPNGAPSHIPYQKNILLLGQGLGNIALIPIAKAMKEAGCHIMLMAAYAQKHDILELDTLQQSCDELLICLKHESNAQNEQHQNRSTQWVKGSLKEGLLFLAHQYSDALKNIDHIMVIAAPVPLHIVQNTLKNDLSHVFSPHITMEGIFTSPMQCMQKGVCARCVQWIVDPKTGKKSPVFTCEKQDQPLLSMDIQTLQMRLGQHRLFF